MIKNPVALAIAAALPAWAVAVGVVLRSLIAEWRRRPAEPGLNTAAQADAFVAEMRRPVIVGRVIGRSPLARPVLGLTVEPAPFIPAGVDGFAVDGRTGPPIEPRLRRTPSLPPLGTAGTPIWDALVTERHRRVEALRMPTREMRVAFDLLAQRWLCTHCESGTCEACAGCSCPCKTAVGARA
jgi:hypothetical protein